MRAHQECSAKLDINGIVGADDLPFLLPQVGRTACSVLEGAHHAECTNEQTPKGNVAALALATYCHANGGPLSTVMNQRAEVAPNTRNAVQECATWTSQTEQRKQMPSDVASFILVVGALASTAKHSRAKIPWIVVAALLARGVAAQQSPCNVGAAADDAGVCDDCAVGKYESGNTCILCPAGLYNANPGSTECSACLPGTFSQGGSSACEDCAAGQTDHDSSATTPCQPCPAHSYGSSTGTLSTHN
eukprot:COSAG02_NODE_5633_length_4170_cov_2.964628_5_plen_247_part_00